MFWLTAIVKAITVEKGDGIPDGGGGRLALRKESIVVTKLDRLESRTMKEL